MSAQKNSFFLVSLIMDAIVLVFLIGRSFQQPERPASLRELASRRLQEQLAGAGRG